MMTFLIPRILFSFFAEFWVRVTSEARESVSVGLWGAHRFSPFIWWGGVKPEGCMDPRPRR